MIRTSRKLLLIIVLLFLLPPAGILLQGKSAAPYFHFPPRATGIAHQSFSWTAFILIALFVLAVCAPVFRHVLLFREPPPRKKKTHSPTVSNRREKQPCIQVLDSAALTSAVDVRDQSDLQYSSMLATLIGGRCGAGGRRRLFPWWGWLGLALISLFWLLAWSRFSWFAPLQTYTFTPLWLGYILTVNGFCQLRRGGSLLTDSPSFFLTLFPASALFWWFFEYLNRFVQNWHYVSIDNLSAVRYALEATISFSTVLPAVLSTTGLLATFPRLTRPLACFVPLYLPKPRFLAWLVLIAAVGGLLGIGIWPDVLYPLLWLAPLMLILGMQIVSGEEIILAPLRRGDWRPVWLPALAALICGFFWELWNWRSLAHWEYTVPLVGRFHFFEMPLLGYAGYLPFGVECLVAAGLLWKLLGKKEMGFNQ
jgi:hypothetical protein